MSTLRVDNLRGQTADGTNRYVVQIQQGTYATQTNSSSSGTLATGLNVSITPPSPTKCIVHTVGKQFKYTK